MTAKNKKNTVCLRCGACCFVDLTAYITDDDLQTWKDEGRKDIIDRVKSNDTNWQGDRIISKNGRKITNCVFLNREELHFFCDIYETRPLVCRNFIPGSSEMCPLYYGKN